MSRVNPVTAVDIQQHPCQEFFVIGVERGIERHDSDTSNFVTKQSYYISIWRHSQSQANRAIKRARLMQDILFQRIQFKEKQQ